MGAHTRNPGLWLALSALVFSPWAVDVFELPHQLVLAVGAVVLACLGTGPSRWMVACALGVLMLGLVSTVTSSAPLLSLPALVTLVVLVSFSTAAEGAQGIDLRPVLWATWPIAAWALLQATGHDFVEWSGAATWCGGVRPFANLGHPTQLGVWMALMAMLAMDRARSRFDWATAVVAGTVCILTLSRAGWLALAVGVASWAWLRRGSSMRPWHLALPLAGLAVPLLLLGPSALLERLSHFFTAPTRLFLWTTAWKGFVEHPLLGWGLDTFTLVDQQFRHPEAWRFEWGGTAAHAHSALPQILATQGLLGMAVFFTLAGLVVLRWRKVPRERRDAGAIAGVLALAAASMVAFSSVPVAALGLCLLVVSLDTASFPRASPRLNLGLVAPGLLLTGLMLAASSSAHFALVRDGEVAHMARWLKMAQRLEPWNALWPTHLGAALERQMRQGMEADLGAARQAYEAGAALAPGVAVYEANVGRIASVLGDQGGARAWFERARRHAPLDARIARDTAEASLQAGDLEVAERTLVGSLSLYPTDGPAWLTLAQLRLRQEREVEARAALEASLSADWRDWPEGPALARGVLAELLLETGDRRLARKVARGPSTWAAPADICGAPAFLAR